MSYSCASREVGRNSQGESESSSKKAGNNKDSSDKRPHHIPATAKPKSQIEMKIKRGCESSEPGVPAITEEELLRKPLITPEDVLGLQNITKSKLADNLTKTLPADTETAALLSYAFHVKCLPPCLS